MLKSLALFLLLSGTVLAQQAANSDANSPVTDEYLKSLAGQTLLLRGRPSITRVCYLPSERIFTEFDDDRSFLYFANQEVELTAALFTDTTSSVCKVKILNDLIEARELTISTQNGDLITQADFAEALKTLFVPAVADSFRPYVKNLGSHIIHYALTNHLPETLSREYLFDVTSADTSFLCPSCFPHFDAIADESEELRLGMQMTDQFETLFPIFDNEVAKLARLRAAGEKVLRSWPTQLRGYQYNFNLVSSRSLNAFAVPGGRVYVTTTLLDACEGDEELEALLAHEIAHVEYSHSIREYRKAQAAGRWGALFVGLAGVAVGAASNDNNVTATALEISAALATMVSQLVVQGYSRDLERESDAFAHLYLEKEYGKAEGLVGVLSKLAYHGSETPSDTAYGSLDSHPTLYQRLYAVERGNPELFNPPLVFTGYDAKGRAVATVKIVARDVVPYVVIPTNMPPNMRKYSIESGNMVALYADISATRFLKAVTEIKDIKLKLEGNVLELDNRADTKLTPTQHCGVVFGTKTALPISLATLSAIKIPSMKLITHWERAQ
ncbi:MAG: M48 family metallopeptidase [Candidatus Zixiibacteriota bacterium]